MEGLPAEQREGIKNFVVTKSLTCHRMRVMVEEQVFIRELDDLIGNFKKQSGPPD
jgi:hypothetical protein